METTINDFSFGLFIGQILILSLLIFINLLSAKTL